MGCGTCPDPEAGGAHPFLIGTKLEDLMAEKAQEVVLLRDSTTVELALKVLSKYGVLSAPVVRCDEEPEEEGAPPPDAQWPSGVPPIELLDFCDIGDLLDSFLNSVDVDTLLKMNMLQRMQALEEAGPKWSSLKLKEISELGGDGIFLHAQQASATMMELIHYGFLYPRHKAMHDGKGMRSPSVHRIALFDNEGCVTRIVSMSDIAQFMAGHTDKIGELSSQTLTSLGLTGRQLITISPETSAFEALILMKKTKVSGVAVLDCNGKLIGNFSLSELRAITPEHFGALALPVGEFLAWEHGTEFAGYKINSAHNLDHKFMSKRSSRDLGGDVGQKLVVVNGESSFAEVLSVFAANRIHRVYVVQADGTPSAVITITDMLRTVLEDAHGRISPVGGSPRVGAPMGAEGAGPPSVAC